MNPATVPRLSDTTGIALAMAMTATHQLPLESGSPVQLPPQARGIFPLIDGVNTVADIAARLETRGVEADQFRDVWRKTVQALAHTGLLQFTQGRS
ncbi:hypothetical protein GOB90_12900 [Acetobacter oeni]|nr:hypothetical protein [Acetobacter oeni]